MRRLLKWLFRGVTVVLVLLLLTGLAAVFTLTTESGTRWALNRLSGMVSGELTVPEFRGNLWNGLQLQKLSYADASMELHARNLDVQISWSAAVRGQVVFGKLHAGHVLVRSRKPPDPVPQPLELDIPPLGFVLGVQDGQVAQLETEGYGDTRDFREIHLERLLLENDKVSLESASLFLADLGVIATLTGVEARPSGDFPLSGNLQWKLSGDEWSGHGPVSGSLARLVFDQELSGPYPLRLEGSVAILNQLQPEFDMQASAVQWQIGELTLSRGSAQMKGNLDQYLGQYDLDVIWPEFPPIRLQGQSEGTLQSLAQIKASLESSAGTVLVGGKLTWLPEFTAELDLNLAGFDPSVLFSDFTGQLDATAQMIVENPETWSFHDTRISGVINDADISANGDLVIGPQDILCRGCVLVSGANRAEIDGKTGPENIAFDLLLNAPSIGSFWHGLGGQVQASGRVEGNFDLPMFSGNLTAEDLAWEGWTAKKLLITSTASGFAEVNLALTGEQLAYEGTALGRIEAISRGKTDRLTVDATWNFQDQVLTIGADVLSKAGLVSGRVREARLSEPTTGDWTLSDAFEFTYRDGSLILQPHQWQSAAGFFEVIRMESANGETALAAALSGLPLQLANPFLPGAYRLDGTARADLDVVFRQGTWNGAVNWSQDNTLLSLININGQQSDVRVPSVSLQALLADGGADMTAQISIDPGVSGELQLSLDRLARDANITAALSLQGKQWAWISALLPEIDKFEGSISANFRAEGPLDSPQLTGALNLREGRLVIPALNVPIENISLELAGAPNGAATVRASATAGERPLELNGRIENLLFDQRTIELELTGRAAELFNWPEYHVWASPEIRISGDASGWDVGGTLTIPRAEVNVKTLPVEAVEISPDVRITGEPVQAEVSTSYSGTVRVILGENVHINAFGLETRLTGSLQVGMYRDRPMSADGQVKLEDGTFSAYGRKLTIRDSTLNFTGPLNDPLVDVRAIREIEGVNGKVIAGIHLTGRAENLSSTIYSEPAMAEADALSYLVLGRPLSQATLAEGNELSGAAIALGLGQASRITEQIGRTLGLDQLALAGDGGETTALVAGKQINNRLYARYAYGVFSRVGTLLLRYRLSRRLTMEAAAGEAQTIELLYTVEKP